MTKGELIVACIKLMYDNNTEQIDTLAISSNPNYTERTANIVESINRALYRILELGKIPKKTFIINDETTVISENVFYKRYELSTLIEDYLFINSVSKQDIKGNYNANVSVRIEGTSTLVLPLEAGTVYIINYTPQIKEIDYMQSDTEVIDYPNYILSKIPYFVKADLYEEENPSMAHASRNIFENYIYQLPTNKESEIKETQNVYINEWY